MALSLLGSANLLRPGLRPNGSSHTVSRHRPEATAAKGPCTLARRRRSPQPPNGRERNERAWKEHWSRWLGKEEGN